MIKIFWKNYHGFSKQIVQQVNDCRSQLRETEVIVQKTMMYYGEDPKEKNFNDFITNIIKFIDDMHASSAFPHPIDDHDIEDIEHDDIVSVNDALEADEVDGTVSNNNAIRDSAVVQ
jgi:hypothetical protein